MILTNKGLKAGLDPIDNNFGDNIILGVTKASGSEIPKGCCIFTLRDQTKIVSISPSIYSMGRESVGTEVKEEKT